MRKYKSRESGFTYVEVIVCLCVATLIVGPLSYALLNSIRTRVNATHIDEATSYAEELMINIKEKMTEDINQKYQVDQRRIDIASWDATKKADAKSGVGQYLLKSTDSEIAALTERPRRALYEFLGETLSGGKSPSDTRYDTEKYAYEIALWRMEDLPLTSDPALTSRIFTLDKDTLKDATKFYTDADSKYQFEDTFYTSTANPITFKVTDAMLKTFVDQDQIYIPNYAGEEKIIDINRINFKDAAPGEPESEDEIEAENSEIHFNKTRQEIKVGSNTCGYHYTITEHGTSGISDTDAKKYTSIMDVDLGTLIKDENGNTITTYKGYTLKFTNTTRFDQVIRVGHHLDGVLDTTAQEIYDSIHIIVEDVPKTGELATSTTIGKSTISRINKENHFENYLIAIIVREKSPVQGEEGKIVKKMIDVYSYDVNAS